MAKAKVLTKDEIKRVMRIAETGNNGLRDRVALSLSVLAGMRIGEISKLTIGDVRGLDGKAVEVINLSKHQTKGNRSRRVFVSDELRKLLNSYIATISKLNGSKALIRSSRTGSHFSNVSLSLRFKAIYAAAGISTSSHSGRRTFATQKNALGIGMRTIQHLLGHANITTTALYCDVSDEQLKNAANAA
ncbi:tyrosine-type recombinase/integrase [Microcystis aeruginosa]|jgi:integrase/recombinase XerD|uniref:tyrosine-type recombinase/integrase n=1 Tax=Microcystis aeruginosa TaxID=1126 RepID=UPI0023305D58|nr:tyrosine-type recombinase/integrase [Microcystis aeruginosa]MDB9412379.1 tyrosine-type recombinase/integrase [Microcystis aeruginosa CS-567/02]